MTGSGTAAAGHATGPATGYEPDHSSAEHDHSDTSDCQPSEQTSVNYRATAPSDGHSAEQTDLPEQSDHPEGPNKIGSHYVAPRDFFFKKMYFHGADDSSSWNYAGEDITTTSSVSSAHTDKGDSTASTTSPTGGTNNINASSGNDSNLYKADAPLKREDIDPQYLP
jgi:hypothetical protein